MDLGLGSKYNFKDWSTLIFGGPRRSHCPLEFFSVSSWRPLILHLRSKHRRKGWQECAINSEGKTCVSWLSFQRGRP